MDYESSHPEYLGGYLYASDDPTYRVDFDDFFGRFDEDILPLCKSDEQAKKLLKTAIMPYLNNEWPEFVRRIEEGLL